MAKLWKSLVVTTLTVCSVLVSVPAQAQPHIKVGRDAYTVDVAGTEYDQVQAAKVWAACGANSPAEKKVRKFKRNGQPGLRGTSVLRCGNNAFGFHHIYNRHHQDWERIGAQVGDPQWRSIADFAIAQTLNTPEKGSPTHQVDNDKWIYRAPLHIRDNDGKVVKTYRPLVAVSGKDGKIITAFPRR